MRRIQIIIFLMFFIIMGCMYELRVKYPKPIPTKSYYYVNGVSIFVVDDEEEFQELVIEQFGERDDSCQAFVTKGGGLYRIYILRSPNGSISLDWLGHELYYHIMEGWNGHEPPGRE